MDILTNESYRQYTNLSRYTLVPSFYNTLDGRYQQGFPIHLDSNIPAIQHKILAGDTLDSISLYYYGNPTYYWIIADFNGILDPFIPLKVGEILLVPTFSSIVFNED